MEWIFALWIASAGGSLATFQFYVINVATPMNVAGRGAPHSLLALSEYISHDIRALTLRIFLR